MARKKNLLKGTRVYLSGPMDFVYSRSEEKRFGWRTRITQFLKGKGVTVFDPWNKPRIRGFHEYGLEDTIVSSGRDKWTFESSAKGSRLRSECASEFWETLHIDLRMVDLSDFIIAYVPTNIYSVGTVHEIIVAREQHKPVLFVSPPVRFPKWDKLEQEVKGNRKLEKLVAEVKRELPVKENPNGIPSLWYMPLIRTECFFDGFGFMDPRYKKTFRWNEKTDLDRTELHAIPQRPLLDFLESLSEDKLPQKWNRSTQKMEYDDDWLIFREDFLASDARK